MPLLLVPSPAQGAHLPVKRCCSAGQQRCAQEQEQPLLLVAVAHSVNLSVPARMQWLACSQSTLQLIGRELRWRAD